MGNSTKRYIKLNYRYQQNQKNDNTVMHSTNDIQDLGYLIRADQTINVSLKDENKNEQWIVDDIVSLEKRLQDKDDFNGYCTHTFRNWRFGETTNDGSITGVTVDLMITFNKAI
mgnify:CR=1 FL=1